MWAWNLKQKNPPWGQTLTRSHMNSWNSRVWRQLKKQEHSVLCWKEAETHFLSVNDEAVQETTPFYNTGRASAQHYGCTTNSTIKKTKEHLMYQHINKERPEMTWNWSTIFSEMSRRSTVRPNSSNLYWQGNLNQCNSFPSRQQRPSWQFIWLFYW